jgi:hypothetical protein
MDAGSTAMSEEDPITDLARGGSTSNLPSPLPEELVRLGMRAGLHRIASSGRHICRACTKVLVILRGLSPESVLDIGSGRRVYLWPLLDNIPGRDRLVTAAEARTPRRL